MSALVPKTDIGTNLGCQLFDHFIGAVKQRMRHSEAERLGSLEIDHQFEPGWPFDWHISDLDALKDTVDVIRCALVYVRQIWAVCHQPTSPGKSGEETDCW